MNRTFPLLVAALFAAFLLPDNVFGQAAKNTNQSRKWGSVIGGGWGNLIASNSTAAFIGGGQRNKVATNAGRRGDCRRRG